MIDLQEGMVRMTPTMSTQKETRLNLRMKDSFRAEMETLADYLGLTLSSYAHSLLVRSVREEKLRYPDAFLTQEDHTEGLIAPDSNHPLPMKRNTPAAKKRTG
jgi:hypothetical protein